MKNYIVTPDALWQMQSVIAPSFSPNGQFLVYTIQKCDKDRNDYSPSFFLRDMHRNSSEEIKVPGINLSYSWTPENTLMFVLHPDQNSSIYRTWDPISHKIKDYKINFFCHGIYFGSEDQLIVFARTDIQSEADEPIIVKEYPYTSNGKGWLLGQKERLAMLSLADENLIYITPEEFHVQQFIKEKNQLFIVGYQEKQKYISKPGLYCYDFRDRHLQELITPGNYYIRQIFCLANQIFFAGSRGDRYGRYEYTGFYRYDMTERIVELFAPYEASVGVNSIMADSFSDPGKKMCVWNDTLYFISTVDDRSGICCLHSNATITQFLSAADSVESIDISQGQLVYCGTKNFHTAELYQITGDQEECLVQIEQLEEQYSLSYPEEITFCDPDGYVIRGWILKPINFEKNKKYSAVLCVHGGPRCSYAPIYLHELQCIAAQGRFVLYCNPRGSDSRGNEFGNINGQYGTVDMRNLLQMVEESVQRYPQIDTNRLAIDGGSYGGFMVNWIIGHSNQFAAAVSHRSIANWVSHEAISDIGMDYVQDQVGASLLWNNLDYLWEHSPLRFARNVKTPTLFIHGEQDMRCSLSEAQQMYYVLHQQQVPTKLLVFKGENHELLRAGKPKNRIRALKEINLWFDQYLSE